MMTTQNKHKESQKIKIQDKEVRFVTDGGMSVVLDYDKVLTNFYISFAKLFETNTLYKATCITQDISTQIVKFRRHALVICCYRNYKT